MKQQVLLTLLLTASLGINADEIPQDGGKKGMSNTANIIAEPAVNPEIKSGQSQQDSKSQSDEIKIMNKDHQQASDNIKDSTDVKSNQANQGSDGNQANQSSDGNQSNQGSDGNQANQGTDGNQANQGSDGNQSNQGSDGNQSNQGSDGNQANQGTDGNQSNQGMDDNQGQSAGGSPR
jgi:hypothetical protein